MRVVLLGKGGSGKSSIAGLVASELRNRGEQVLAIDADTVPGLAQVLGLEPTDDWFLAGMAVRDHGSWKLEGSPAETVERAARTGPGGVRFLQVGNADGGLGDFEFRRESNLDRWSGMVAFHTVARTHDDCDGWVVVDLPGGTLQVAAGMVGTTGVAMVVVEPFAKSVLTVRRFVEMGRWPVGIRLVAVANKVASEEDRTYIDTEMAALGLPVWGMLPEDPAVRQSERDGQALVTVDQDSPAKRAIAQLVDRLGEHARESAAAPLPLPA